MLHRAPALPLLNFFLCSICVLRVAAVVTASPVSDRFYKDRSLTLTTLLDALCRGCINSLYVISIDGNSLETISLCPL